MSENNDNALVKAEDLKVYFPVHAGTIFKKKIGDIRAVDGISFQIRQGETLGLVGESGSGKTTVGQALLKIHNITGGRIFFEGKEISGLKGKEKSILYRKMQMIFQDPFSSLNPRMKVRDSIGDPLRVHKLVSSRTEYLERTDELLTIVGLDPAMGDRYPHEFSGGQRQRIGIARALALKPSFIVCDEPVSALDVSIQAQILNLLEDLQEKFDLTYLFIAHDLAVVRHISSRIAVMYLGELVEIATRLELYQNPSHPYTRALLSAVPIANPTIESQREHIILKGEMPSPLHPPSGCRFSTRCEAAIHDCSHVEPEMKEISSGHYVSCLLYK